MFMLLKWVAMHITFNKFWKTKPNWIILKLQPAVVECTFFFFFLEAIVPKNITHKTIEQIRSEAINRKFQKKHGNVFV